MNRPQLLEVQNINGRPPEQDVGVVSKRIKQASVAYSLQNVKQLRNMSQAYESLHCSHDEHNIVFEKKKTHHVQGLELRFHEPKVLFVIEP
jgi:hypothetical protein